MANVVDIYIASKGVGVVKIKQQVVVEMDACALVIDVLDAVVSVACILVATNVMKHDIEANITLDMDFAISNSHNVNVLVANVLVSVDIVNVVLVCVILRAINGHVVAVYELVLVVYVLDSLGIVVLLITNEHAILVSVI